jgi:hypothetical protein
MRISTSVTQGLTTALCYITSSPITEGNKLVIYDPHHTLESSTQPWNRSLIEAASLLVMFVLPRTFESFSRRIRLLHLPEKLTVRDLMRRFIAIPCASDQIAALCYRGASNLVPLDEGLGPRQQPPTSLPSPTTWLNPVVKALIGALRESELDSISISKIERPVEQVCLCQR